MWCYSLKRKFRMKEFHKTVEFKNLFSREPGYEDYKTVKPRLYQAKKTAKKGRKKNGNGQNRNK